MLLHYNMDGFKARLLANADFGQGATACWRFLGLDQAAHQLTYAAMLAVLVMLGPP